MNSLKIAGIISELMFSHSTPKGNFWKCKITSVRRNDNSKDTLIVLFPEFWVDVLKGKEKACIIGELRTKNIDSQVLVFVFAKDIIEYSEDINEVSVSGSICINRGSRDTKNGIVITDFILRNDINGKNNYIPCIAWNKSARIMANKPVGYNVLVKGRFQSREYHKKLDNDDIVKNTAYELSGYYFESYTEET